MTDRKYIIQEIQGNVNDLRQVLLVEDYVTTEALVKAMEKTIFNFTCLVSGYYHDKECAESITD